ncbi:MAG: hypothetical protein M3P95_00170 [Actinomycetota bacterium]|nr:hypothetical protein [Actinomycetota bacterium]
MLVVVVVAGIGVVLLLFGLLAADLLDGVADVLHTGDAGVPLTTEVVGAFLAVSGSTAALLAGADAGPLPATGLGLAAGLPSAWLTARLTRALSGMATDPTPCTTDLVGHEATVVTPIPAGSLGEVVLTQVGQRVKLSARAEAAQPAGRRVWVTGVVSSTCVSVTGTDL